MLRFFHHLSSFLKENLLNLQNLMQCLCKCILKFEGHVKVISRSFKKCEINVEYYHNIFDISFVRLFTMVWLIFELFLVFWPCPYCVAMSSENILSSQNLTWPFDPWWPEKLEKIKNRIDTYLPLKYWFHMCITHLVVLKTHSDTQKWITPYP